MRILLILLLFPLFSIAQRVNTVDINATGFKVPVVGSDAPGFKIAVYPTGSVPNAAPVITSVMLNASTFEVGQTAYISYTYSDAELDYEGFSIKAIYRADNTAGLNETLVASGTSYTFTDADIGKYFRAAVTGVAITGTSSSGIAVYSTYTNAITSHTTIITDSGSTQILAYSAHIAVTSNGPVEANSLYPTYFTNSLDTKGFAPNYSDDSVPYLYAQNGTDTILQTNRIKQNAEVDWYSVSSKVFMRAHNGNYIAFQMFTNNGNWRIILTVKNRWGTAELWRMEHINVNLPGFSQTHSLPDDYFTSIVDGIHVYLKFHHGTSDTTIASLSDWRLPMEAGTFGAVEGDIKLFDVRELKHEYYYSNFAATYPIIYFKDFGLHEAVTTGSITVNTNQITVANSSLYKIGETVIMEIGGEAGEGHLGTEGVGGTYPYKSYANLTAMYSDHSQPDETAARDASTGLCYRSLSGVWTSHYSPFLQKSIPISLRGRITSIVGNVLVIDKYAQASSTNAKVYFDNSYIINKLTTDGSSFYDMYPSDITRDLSAITPDSSMLFMSYGEYAVGNRIFANGRSNLTIRGVDSVSSTSYTPKGVPSFKLWVTACNNFKSHDWGYRGNAGTEYFGLVYWEWEKDYQSDTVKTVFENKARFFSYGLQIEDCDSTEIYNMRMQDMFAGATTTKNSHGSYIHDCQAYLTTTLLGYVGWLFQTSQSTGDRYENLKVVSEKQLTGGYEAFACESSTFTNCNGINAAYSFNTTNHNTYIHCIDTVRNGALNGYQVGHALMPINTNIDFTSGGNQMMHGARIEDFHFVVQGVSNIETNEIIGGIDIGNYDSVYIINSSYTSGDYIDGQVKNPQAIAGTIADRHILVDGFHVYGGATNFNRPQEFYNSNIALLSTLAEIRNCIIPNDANHCYWLEPGVYEHDNVGVVKGR